MTTMSRNSVLCPRCGTANRAHRPCCEACGEALFADGWGVVFKRRRAVTVTSKPREEPPKVRPVSRRPEGSPAASATAPPAAPPAGPIFVRRDAGAAAGQDGLALERNAALAAVALAILGLAAVYGPTLAGGGKRPQSYEPRRSTASSPPPQAAPPAAPPTAAPDAAPSDTGPLARTTTELRVTNPGVPDSQLLVTVRQNGAVAESAGGDSLAHLPASAMNGMRLRPGSYSVRFYYRDVALAEGSRSFQPGEIVTVEPSRPALAAIEYATGMSTEKETPRGGLVHFQRAAELDPESVPAHISLGIEAFYRKSAPDLKAQVEAIRQVNAQHAAIPRLESLLHELEGAVTESSEVPGTSPEASTAPAPPTKEAHPNAPAPAATRAPGTGPETSAKVGYAVNPRTENRGASPGTGDIILRAEPSTLSVYFYLDGGSELKTPTATDVKRLPPHTASVMAWAPEIRGRARAQVPVRAGSITTVRFRFQNSRLR